MSIQEYYETYPIQTLTLKSGQSFDYRCYKNPSAENTVVLLPGGLGLSDLFYRQFLAFAENFSVLTFDYPTQFKDNAAFAGAVAELMDRLDIRGWLVGQSIGGIEAQIIAKNYPERVEGLILSNTCSLSADMGDDAYNHLVKIMENQYKFRKMLRRMVFYIYKIRIKRAIMKTLSRSLTAAEKKEMAELTNVMMKRLTKPYEYHMIDLLMDSLKHLDMTKEDFKKWDNRVLLVLSQDDYTFNQACKDSLAAVMTNPTVLTDISGSYLSMQLRVGQYVDKVTDYILGTDERIRSGMQALTAENAEDDETPGEGEAPIHEA